MNYEDLTAKELRELCEKKGIKPSRAKADMIEDLKARDAADELTRLDQELEALKAPETPAEPDPAPVVPPAAETAPEEPAWVSDGTLFKRYERHGRLDDREHRSNLTDVLEEAVLRGLDPYGPPFRVTDPDSQTWVYAVNVR